MLTIVEQQQQQQSGGDVDKKKKQQRRSNTRRSKPNSSPLNGSASPEIGDQRQPRHQLLQNSYLANGSSSHQHSPNKTFITGLNSLSTAHIDEQRASVNPHFKVLSKSCQMPNMVEEYVGQHESDSTPPHLVKESSKRKCFEAHWPLDTVNEALQRGEVFQAQIRVNAHNRMEAYCTIEGVPIDVLISGIPRQNRVVEGDVVAVKMDPPQLWSKMKGSLGSGNSIPAEDHNISVATDLTYDTSKGKVTVDLESCLISSTNCSPVYENGCHDVNVDSSVPNQEAAGRLNYIHANGHSHSDLDSLGKTCYSGRNDVLDSVERLRQSVVSMPCKRPTGTIVAIIEPSSRRRNVVGFLDAKWWFDTNPSPVKPNRRGTNLQPHSICDYIYFIPSDPKLPKMIALVRSLPTVIRKKLDDGDVSVETELISAQIDAWSDESLLPLVSVVRCFGRGGEMEPRIAAILSEYGIYDSGFSVESLSCLPDESWKVPPTELECRMDLRNVCVFTIDPSTATDLDDALSVERTSNGRVYRIGVHIADVSYFVQPDTSLDKEAEARSTSVYLMKRKLSMLPPLLSENLGSLIPGVDRLTFSIFWDIDMSGNVLDRWVSRTVIRSCCKLSYENAQDMIEGRVNPDGLKSCEGGFPQLHGHFGWQDVCKSVQLLNEISKALKAHRFNNGALRLENAKISFSLDEFGVPYDCNLSQRKDSNFLVEEFMLLANRTAAEIISRAFPKNALLRRHPGPNMRKLTEFEVFCRKHGFEMNVSSSGSMNRSLEKIKEKLKDDPILYDILLNYATRPMQLAQYFCTGDIMLKKNEWGHYALAVPLYTHFTSPLRRYPDILVHRALSAAVEAEQEYLKQQRRLNKVNPTGYIRCFTGMSFDYEGSQAVETLKALSSAAVKHRLPSTEHLKGAAMHCSAMKLASRQVKDAIDRLYMWSLLRNKEIFLSEARVLGLGPRFMSIYIQRLAIERRIYYDEVDGLIAEWLESTSTLILNYVHHIRSHRGGNMSRYKPFEEAALLDSPHRSESQSDVIQNGDCPNMIDPAVFPLTIHVLSTIPVALHAVGGDDGPIDVAARLYVTSYFR